MATLLLEAKANPNTPDEYCWTPLHSAAIGRNSEMIDLLCEVGADSNALDNKGRTPFMLCAVKPWQ